MRIITRFSLRCVIPLVFFILTFLKCLPSASSLAVMSIDFGSEWMKIAIVSPGVPMEIALNKESKRKTPIAVAFRDGERSFGEDALNVGVRFPKNCYSYLLDLLGKDINNPIVKLFQQRFPYHTLVPDPLRGTVIFKHEDQLTYSVEELVAMILLKAKEIAEASANQPINEAVLTVPGFFNQAERKAIIQAADLAGIKVLQLINAYTAVALNYGIFRRKDFNESTQYIMFYDMGASSTTATIVSYQVLKSKEKIGSEQNPQLSIIGVGYDRTLGGLEMQLRLRDYLAKKFNEMKKTSKDVYQNPRALAKLFKEAGRLKNVLSANVDHYAQVEGLIDEIDFKLHITREEFEKLCTDVFDRIKGPIDMALKSSGLSLDVINQMILVGAGTRVPAVQERLESIVGGNLGKNLNTDEAAAFGAVYKAADLSSGFKVKKFITKDGVLFPIQVTLERETENGVKQVKRMLFGQMNPYPQKKVLTFNKHNSDFQFNIGYGELDFLDSEELERLGSLNLSRVSLTGVSDILQKHQGPKIESKGIKAHFMMDESGILSLMNVEFVLEKNATEDEISPEDQESPFSKLGSTISKLFSGEKAPDDPIKENLSEEPTKSGEKEESKVQDKEGSNTEENKLKGDSEKGEGSKIKEEKDSKPKLVTIKEEIPLKQETLIVPALEEQQLQDSFKKIQELNQFDMEKAKREGALNSLESFVFDAKSKLETDEFKVAASKEEVTHILDMCNKVANWLDEEGWEADVSTLEKKLGDLKKLTQPVWWRVQEHRHRPEALGDLDMTLNSSRSFLATIINMTSQSSDTTDPLFTQIEIETLRKLINEVQEWKEKSVVEQNKLLFSEAPKLTVKLILEKISQLDREVKYLVNKAKIWRPKVKEEPLKDANNQTQSDNSTEKIIPENIIPGDEAPDDKKTSEASEGDVSMESNTTIPENVKSAPEPDTKSHVEL